MGVNNRGTASSLEKLSSGFRINRAGDDAAGLAISEKMRAQVRGLNRASANAQDGISLIQAAEGALQETHAILQRMRELGIQAANDVNETVDRQAIQDEINQLTREVDRIAVTTEFNRMTILDGSLDNGMYIRNATGFNVSSLSIVPNFNAEGDVSILPSLTSVAVTTAGVNFDQTFNFALVNDPAVDGVTNGLTDSAVSGSTIQIEMSAEVLISAGLDPANNTLMVAVNAGENGAVIAGNVRDTLQIALGADWTVTTTGGRLNIQHNFIGAFDDGFEFTLNAGESAGMIFTEGWDTGVGSIGRDAVITLNGGEGDVLFSEDRNNNFLFDGNGSEVAGQTLTLRGRDSIALLFAETDTDGAETAFSFRIDDAARLSGAIVSVAQGSEMALQIGANVGYDQTMRLAIGSLSATSLGIGELNVLDHVNAQNSVAGIDGALQQVSDVRAGLGAIQNRLEHTIANLDTVAENLQDAESRIRDVDMAREMMNFTKFNILTQAAQAMMAQANNLPQGVLQLLR
jgi:flagellin